MTLPATSACRECPKTNILKIVAWLIGKNFDKIRREGYMNFIAEPKSR
jgi:hypothetical protein